MTLWTAWLHADAVIQMPSWDGLELSVVEAQLQFEKILSHTPPDLSAGCLYSFSVLRRRDLLRISSRVINKTWVNCQFPLLTWERTSSYESRSRGLQ